MVILCPSCVSSYRVDPDQMRRAFGTMRCAHCRNIFPLAAASTVEHGGMERLPGSAAVPALLPAPQMTGDGTVEPIRRAPQVAAPPPHRERSAFRGLAAATICLALAMAALAGQDHIARAVPLTSRVFAAIGLSKADGGLSLTGVQTSLADEGQTKVLTLEGQISNAATGTVAVPDLRIIVRDGAAQNLYSWTTPSPRSRLAPGERVAFRSRLVSPPAGGHDVVVRFADTIGDVKAGEAGTDR